MEQFDAHRPLLFGIAYRMLGSAMDAEDIVQEAYLRYRDVPPGTIHAPKAYLSKVVTHLCLDQLKSASAQRESYIGTWLPEPVLTSDQPMERAIERESLSMAFLLMLDKLSPPERAVFVLREVFDYGYDEIAEVVGKSEAACRQLLHRARAHLAEQPAYPPADTQTHQQVIAEFIQAISSGDLPRLLQLFTDDALSWADSGGKAQAGRRPVIGRDPVARFLLGLGRKVPPGFGVSVEQVNGQPAIVMTQGDVVFGLILFDLRDSHIQRVHYVVNPDKLRLMTLPT
jgi:RNA polymerase sigma-70 factor (ECF subfamily)